MDQREQHAKLLTLVMSSPYFFVVPASHGQLQQRLGDVVLHHLPQRLAVRIFRQTGIQAFERGLHLAGEHHLAVAAAPQQAVLSKAFLVLGGQPLPAELLL